MPGKFGGYTIGEKINEEDMNTDQIDKILKSNSVTKKYYQGCFPSDQPPHELSYPASIIFNLDKSNREGSHWIGMFIMGPKKEVNYFDSYGIEPLGNIKNFLKKYPKIIMNRYPYQSLYSDVCGHYCITFIYFLSLGYSFDRFIKMLDSNINTDLFVKTIVKEMIK